MLLAAAIQQQCKIIDLGIARDEEDRLNEVLDAAVNSNIDILITSGGVSMGDKDFVKPCLGKRGIIHFEKVGWLLVYDLLLRANRTAFAV